MLKRLTKLKDHHQTIFAIVIAVAVVSFWRGMWGLMDEYLFPSNYVLSLWISLFAGIIILVATHYVTKELMQIICKIPPKNTNIYKPFIPSILHCRGVFCRR